MDIVDRLRKQAEERAQARKDAEFGPGGGNPEARPEDHLEWEAANEISGLRKMLKDAEEGRDRAIADRVPFAEEYAKAQDRRIEDLTIEQERATVKADAFERDWMAAKREFLSSTSKMRETMHAATRKANRLEKVARMVIEKKLGYHDPLCEDERCLGCLARKALQDE